MLDVPENISVSQKTLNSPYKTRIGWEMAKGQSESDARSNVAKKLLEKRKDPYYQIERDRRIAKEKELTKSLENSDRDPLTGLYNNGYILGRDDKENPQKGILEQEIERILYDAVHKPEKPKKELSIAMLDIDNFKNFNDTFGHQAGDEVLKLVAQTIKKHMRGIDIPNSTEIATLN
mgnify:CR=1 FL=1